MNELVQEKLMRAHKHTLAKKYKQIKTKGTILGPPANRHTRLRIKQRNICAKLYLKQLLSSDKEIFFYSTGRKPAPTPHLVFGGFAPV